MAGTSARPVFPGIQRQSLIGVAGSVEQSLAPALRSALALTQPDFDLRPEAAGDLEFLAALYASTRWEELAPVDWPEAAKREFLDQQFQLQHAHYLQHYAGAEMLLIVAARQARQLLESQPDAHWPDPASNEHDLIGRIYFRAGSTEVRLMEIALLPAYRGRGIGCCLVQTLQAQAAQRGVDITLHVEPDNRAQRLYQRLGFKLIEQRGVYDFLGWSPPLSAGNANGS